MRLADAQIDRILHRGGKVKNLTDAGRVNLVHPVGNPGFGHFRVSVFSVTIFKFGEPQYHTRWGDGNRSSAIRASFNELVDLSAAVWIRRKKVDPRYARPDQGPDDRLRPP